MIKRLGLTLVLSLGAVLNAQPLAQSNASVYLWADKYVYTPGEPLTVRWTIQGGDDAQYTIFAYRQNNQNGQRFFLPRGTAEVTDIFGNTENFRKQSIPEAGATKQVVLGEGGLLGPAVTVPEEYGMHTLVVQFRDASGNRVVKSAYFKIGVVRTIVDVADNITADRTWTNDRAYRLTGRILIRNGATLTIEPGTFVLGTPGSQPPSILVVSTDGRLVAEGTRSRPIVMTSSQPFGQRRPGDWGGLIMLGLAPINVQGGSSAIEGLPETPETRYGGNRPEHDCGTLRYVRVEYAGVELSPANETNGITTGGCGKRTVMDHLQVHFGLDDSFEFFGGTHDAKYLVASYQIDDGIDIDFGYSGRIQHAVVVLGPQGGNNGLEADGNLDQPNATPFTNPTWYNVTMVGNYANASNQNEAVVAGLFLRRGVGGSYNNTLVYHWRGTAAATSTNAAQGFASLTPRITAGILNANGILAWENGSTTAAATLAGQYQDLIRPWISNDGAVKKVAYADPMLRRPFDLNNPDFRPRPDSIVYGPGWIQPPDDGFFDQWAQYIGAFGDIDWTEEWTNFLQEDDLKP